VIYDIECRLIPETTLVFFETNEYQTLGHYSHFMEYMLGLWYCYKGPAGGGEVSLILSPDNGPDKWRKSANSLPQKILGALFPGVPIWDRTTLLASRVSKQTMHACIDADVSRRSFKVVLERGTP
jgi:hypothetical protein